MPITDIQGDFCKNGILFKTNFQFNNFSMHHFFEKLVENSFKKFKLKKFITK